MAASPILQINHFSNHFQLQHLGASFSIVLGSSCTKLMLLWGYEIKLPLKDTMTKTTTFLNSLVIMLSSKLSSLLQGIICKDWKIRVRYMNSQTILKFFYERNIYFFDILSYVMPINPNRYQFHCDNVNFYTLLY